MTWSHNMLHWSVKWWKVWDGSVIQSVSYGGHYCLVRDTSSILSSYTSRPGSKTYNIYILSTHSPTSIYECNTLHVLCMYFLKESMYANFDDQMHKGRACGWLGWWGWVQLFFLFNKFPVSQLCQDAAILVQFSPAALHKCKSYAAGKRHRAFAQILSR